MAKYKCLINGYPNWNKGEEYDGNDQSHDTTVYEQATNLNPAYWELVEDFVIPKKWCFMGCKKAEEWDSYVCVFMIQAFIIIIYQMDIILIKVGIIVKVYLPDIQ